jgi:hypothetical protein
LIGIWIVCGGFAIIGHITSFVERRHAVKEQAQKAAEGSLRLSSKVVGGLTGQPLVPFSNQKSGKEKETFMSSYSSQGSSHPRGPGAEEE